MTENTQTAFEAHEVSEEGRGNVAVGSPDEPLTTTQNPSDGAIVPIVPDEAKAPSRTGSQTSRLSRHSGDSTTSRQSVHVQIPEGVKPGEKFYVVVDNLEYEVWAPEDSSPGEMVAMEVFSNLAESQAALTASRESARSGRSHTKNSEAESVATDGSLVYVQIPEGCVPGETFFTEVNGFEYEILVPSNCESGDLIYLEVPAKHAISKFVVPENSEAPVITDILNEEPSSDGHLADVCVPAGVRAGQTFVVIIEGVEFEVPVPEGYGPGDLLSLQMPSKGMQTTSVASSAIAGLEEVRAELEQVRAELREVKEQHLRETLRREQEGRFVNESKSSGDSNFIQIQIPLDCYEGDAFVVEVDDAEFQMVVPLGCSPGEVIYMDMREGAGYPIENPTTQQKNTSRPASGVRKVAKDILPEEDVHETDSAVAISSISEPQETLEIVIPEDCYEGDIFVIEVKGVELELTVPDGCQPGELIYVDVPREGSSVVTSRPASANQKLSHENVAKQEREQLERKQQEEAARMQEEAAAATIQDIKEEDATSSSQEAMEIIIPQDCYPGDIFVIEVKGVELELTVPDGCQPGELIYVDVPREGSTVVTSRPASAEQQKQFAAKQQELARQAEEEAAQAAEAAKKEKDREEAQRWRADSKKQQAINKAEREAQEEEARIKREEDEKRGKDVMSVFSGQVQALLADAVGETFKSEREENQAPVSEGGHVAAGHPGTKSSLTESQSVMSVPHSKSQTGYAEPAEAAEATDRATEEAEEQTQQTQQTQQTVSGESGESGEKAGKAETVETGAETLETTQEVDAKEEGKAMTSVASVAVAVASRSPSVTSRHSSRHSSHSSYSIHVQVPDGVYPGDRFLVMVDDREYEVIAPSGSAPGEMVAMDICSDIDGDPRISLTVSKESKDSKHPQGSPGLQASQVGTAQSQDARVSENVDKGDKAKKNTDPRSTTNVSTASDAVSGSDSVAADAILVPVEIPDGCSEGETFFAEVNGVEYEILVPNGCTSGHLIYLEIPGKHAIGKFVTPETADSLPAQVPEVSVKDMVSVDSPGEDSLFAEVTVPDGAQEGQNFIAIIDGTEFEVPVPEGFQAGDALSLQLPPSGLQADPTSSALQEVWAEIAKVREELKRVQEDRVRLREEDLRLGPGGSKSSADSNIVEILIPPDCHAGDSFIVEVDDAEFEMVVPDGCGPGERIYMDMLEGAGHTPENLTKKQKRSSRPASGVRKVQKEHEGPRHEVVEITIPEDCYAGDVFTVEVKGKELEMTVPDGCQPGDALLMDLLPEGTLTNSRPASAKKETITESVAEQGTAGQEAARKEHPSGQEGGKQDGAARQEEISALKEQAERSKGAEAEAEAEAAEAAVAQEAAAKAEVHAETEETEEVTVLEVVEAYRLAVSILSGSDLIAEADASCACRIKGQEEAEFQTASLGDRVNPQWNHEHVMEEFTPGQVLQFELTETMGGSQFVIGTVELVWEDFSEGLNESKSLTGTDGLIHIKIENLGTVAEHVAKLDAERLEAERIEAERLEAERLEKERQEAERLAEEAAAEMARKEAEERERMAEAERQSREVEEAIAAEEAERQRQEALRQQAIEEEERRKREEEEREAAKEAAKKAKEEAERQRLELLKQQQLEEAERAIREEEARIKREEAERKGKIVISVTVLNDETEEVMAKASLRLGCKVLELGQVCVREARLSVAPAIYSEPKPEPKLVRGKMEYRERFALPPEDTLLEAGVENNAVLRAKISSAVITASKDCTARVWNAETGSCELVLEGHNEAVCSACISPDCRYVATSSEDSSARLWYVDSGRCARVLQDHKEAVYSASFSPDSKQVVTASEDGTAKIWVVKTGLCKLTLKGHNFAVLWAAFSPDGRSVTTTSSDGTLKIWNAKTGVCDRTLLGQKPVYLASFATDGTTFVTASGDATAKICDLMTGESKIVLSGHDNLVLGASYAPSCPQAEQQTEQQKDENG